MNLVFFNSNKAWGGGEKWHFEMAIAMAERKMQVCVAGNTKAPFIQKAQQAKLNTQTFKVFGLSFLNPVKLWQVCNFFKKNATDIVILNMSMDLKLAGIAARLAGVKHIIYRRGSAIPIKNKVLNRFLFKYIVTQVLANSEETKRTVLSNNPKLFPKEKIRVIYNGLDLSRFASPKEKPVTQTVILGNLARLSKQKGQKYLIPLAKKLKLQNVNFKIRIGGIGELEQELKQRVETEKLADVIEFTGFVNDPKKFLETLDIFVFPSVWEGFGFSIIEAKLCQKPVVAFAMSSNPEVIVDGVDGFLVPPLDENAFYERTLQLITDARLRNAMGIRGREDAIKRFSQEKCITEVHRFLTQL